MQFIVNVRGHAIVEIAVNGNAERRGDIAQGGAGAEAGLVPPGWAGAPGWAANTEMAAQNIEVNAMAERAAALPEGNSSDSRLRVVFTNCRSGGYSAGLGSGEERNVVKFLSKPVV